MRRSSRAGTKDAPGQSRVPTPWSLPVDALLQQLGSDPSGLSSTEAVVRLDRYGLNQIGGTGHARRTSRQLIGQFTSPIVLTLMAAAILSAFLRDLADAGIILFIVVVSGWLGFWQERGAANAVSELLAMVRTTVQVLRDGRASGLALVDVVPGDVVILPAGVSFPPTGSGCKQRIFSRIRPPDRLNPSAWRSVQGSSKRQPRWAIARTCSSWAPMWSPEPEPW